MQIDQQCLLSTAVNLVLPDKTADPTELWGQMYRSTDSEEGGGVQSADTGVRTVLW